MSNWCGRGPAHSTKVLVAQSPSVKRLRRLGKERGDQWWFPATSTSLHWKTSSPVPDGTCFLQRLCWPGWWESRPLKNYDQETRADDLVRPPHPRVQQGGERALLLKALVPNEEQSHQQPGAMEWLAGPKAESSGEGGVSGPHHCFYRLLQYIQDHKYKD